MSVDRTSPKPVSATICVQLPNDTWRAMNVPAFTSMPALEARLRENTEPEQAAALVAFGGSAFDSYLSAVLNAGVQAVNYIYAGGEWFFSPTLNASERTPLLPRTEADGPTDKQLSFFYRITKSHHFDRERETLHEAIFSASVEDCSLLLDWLKREIELRKKQETSSTQRAR